MQNNTFTKPKLLILSDSALGITGYGNQSKKIALTAHEHGWDVTHLSHNYWGQPLQKVIFEDGEIIPYKIIPGSTRVPYAQDKLQEILLKEKWNCFIIVLDTFMMFPFLLHINIPCKSVFWFPSDGGWFPHDGSSPQGCEAILQKVDFPIAMAEFGKNQVKRLFNISTECIPLGVDTAKYYPFNNQERMRCREWISNKVGVDLRNKFIIGSVVRNQPRKAMDRTIKSIAYLEKIMPEADYVLLWHTDANDPAAASNLKKLAERYKVSHRIVFTGMTAIKGFTDSEMVMLYNCMDLHLTSSCFHPDTPISTSKGFKKIKDIKIGDEVLTIDGSFQKVQDTISYDYNDELLKVETSHNPSVLVTPNHLVYGVECKPKSDWFKKKVVANPNVILKRMDEFKVGDYLLVPRIKKLINKESILIDDSFVGNQFGKTNRLHPRYSPIGEVFIDEDLMWLFGMYLAEGCLSQRHDKPEGIVFCLNSKEVEYTEKIRRIMSEKFGISGKVIDDSRHRRRIIFYHSGVGRRFKSLFNSGAKNKVVPEWVLYLNKSLQVSLINGYVAGDGYNEKCKNGSNGYHIDTVSGDLAYFIRLILIRLGYCVSLKIQERKSTVYRLRFYVGGNQARTFMNDDFHFVRINKITRSKYQGQVFDLTVENNHNYCNYWLGKNTGEGFGIPLVEAASCGVPNVTTAYTTTKELVMDDNAGLGVQLVGQKLEDAHDNSEVLLNGTTTGSWHVDRGFIDCEHAAMQIKKLYDDRGLCKLLGSNGRKMSVEKYDWEGVIKLKWLRLLQKCLE